MSPAGTQHRIIVGDARRLDLLRDVCVHLVITSPPYWQLKDYGVPGQIGYDDSYEDYVNNLNRVWLECIRVLHPGCRLCVNIGDQFARAVYYGRYKVIPIRTEIIRFCECAGLDYMGAIIWQKVTTCNTSGGATIMGSFPHPRNGIVKIDYEFILLFKKPGKAPKPSARQKSGARMTTEEWNTFFAGHWTFPGERNNAHLAPFPEELPTRLIRMFSFPGETVLDPFSGSGTTSVAAMHLGRSSVGYETNADFARQAYERLEGARGLMEAGSVITLEEPEISSTHDVGLPPEMPYVFRDPVVVDRKVDPKKLRFGSRIDGNERSTRRLKVRKIVSATEVELDTGQRVKLLGVTANEALAPEAMQFLTETAKGKEVSLKFDPDQPAQDGLVYAYVYLRNRTFLNAHLLKKGLAKADRNHTYRLREKFLAFERRGT